MDDLGCFPFGTVVYSAAMNILVHGFGEGQHMLGRYLGVELGDRMKALDF